MPQPAVDSNPVTIGGTATAIFGTMTRKGVSFVSIADRIRNLRKARGISQEEFADQIGVSRQAVSKWESEQSTPDIDKIILISDFFGVTTDYLLKGVEPQPQETRRNPDAVIFSIIGTALNIIGVIAAIWIWYEQRRPLAAAVGLILMTVGCVIFAIGQSVGDSETKAKAKKQFWVMNVWTLPFIPFSIIINVAVRLFLLGRRYIGVLVPSFLFGNPFAIYGLFWLVYVVICVIVDIMIIKKYKPHKE